MPTDEKKARFGKTGQVITTIMAVPALILTLKYLIILVFVDTGGIKALICGAWLLATGSIFLSKSRIHLILSVLFTLAVLFVLFLSSIFPPSIYSHKPSKYNAQLKYIDMSIYEDGAADFPDVLPKNISDYEFSCNPGFLQAIGHCSARFTASEDIIKDYESEYAPQAIYTIPLKKFNYGRTTVEKISPKAEQSDKSDYSLNIYEDLEFWADTDATVYVLSAVHNWNHPHSSAVIISKDKTKIQFTQLLS